MQAPAVILDQIRLDFDGKPLFADLSLRFAGGRTTCLLGPSGCGKSTLLKLIAGAALPWTGQIGFEPEANGDVRVAWMGQNDLLLPWLSLLENVLLGPRLRGQ
ncbi:MAG: ATP-binding cassette domain-containing protein, partial [Desulfobulbus sp.]|nr:ATP-binding cassette domain-containing protein [Desulfobulbus sp.]